jgi:solute carrier family 6 amino acid transporter-like protein 5/7/9/14
MPFFIRDAWCGTLADGLTSFYAGFVVFSILGFMANDVGMTMEEISKSASGMCIKSLYMKLFNSHYVT